MSIAELPRTMTAEELLAMPDDGVERWLIRGELRENRESDRNRRNPSHSGTMANLVGRLSAWIWAQPQPRGKLYAGDVAFRLTPGSSSLVGIDVARSQDLTAEAELPGFKVRVAELFE